MIRRRPLSHAVLLMMLTVGVVAAAGPGSQRAEGLEVTYIGNEGFLLEARDGAVLIDALYREGVPGYVVHTEELRGRMEGAQPPFAGVDLILATHFHADHYDPRAVGNHLLVNRRGIFVSVPQSVDVMALQFRDYPEVESRVREVYPDEGEIVPVPTKRVRLRVMNLHHGRGRAVENVGFLMELGGMKVLHVGDAMADADDYARYELPAEKIDLAFIPFFRMLSAAERRTIREQIAADRVIIMHMPPKEKPGRYLDARGGWEQVVREIQADLPAVVFREPLESRHFTAKEPKPPTR